MEAEHSNPDHPRNMTKKARVDAAVRNQAVDRPPVSLWRHFYECEENAEGLAGAMLAWHRKYDWDWMKVNPRASYHVEGWGVKLRFSGQPLIKPVVLDVPIKATGDWAKLRPLSTDEGVLDEQLEVCERICEALGGEAYICETVFSPLSIAGDLVATPQQLLADMQADPQAVHGALEVITATFRDFVTRLLKAGADGLFFATTEWATRDTLSDELYAEFGRPYDLQVLAAAQDAAFNVLHVCKNHNMVLELADYPVHAINWAVGSPGNPPLHEVQARSGKAVIGGLRNETLQTGDPADVLSEARAASIQTTNRLWMLGPACSISVETPDANVRAARQAVDQLTV
jgi:uroporphyrinogen decarboxylase